MNPHPNPSPVAGEGPGEGVFTKEDISVKKLRITVNGVSYEVEVEVLEDDEAGDLASTHQNIAPVTTPHLTPSPVAAMPQPRPVAAPPSSGDKKVLTSPVAGVVVEVKVEAGNVVKENDTVVIIEAMKMKTNINSPYAGRVKDVKVRAGDAVQQNHILVTFE